MVLSRDAISRDKRFDLLIIHDDNEESKALADSIRMSVARKADQAGQLPSVFSPEDHLAERQDAIFNAVLQTRGGGVVLFLLSRDFFRDSLCLALLLSVLSIMDKAGMAEKFKVRFVCLERHVKVITGNSFVQKAVPKLREYTVKLAGQGSVAQRANRAAEAVLNAWIIRAADMMSVGSTEEPSALGGTVQTSFLNLQKIIFTPRDVPMLCNVLQVDDPHSVEVASVLQVAVRDGKVNLYNVSALREVVVRGPAASRDSRLLVLYAYNRKWAQCDSWAWDVNALEGTRGSLATAIELLRSISESPAEQLVGQAMSSANSAIASARSGASACSGSDRETCLGVVNRILSVRSILCGQEVALESAATEWKPVLQNVTRTFTKVGDDLLMIRLLYVPQGDGNTYDASSRSSALQDVLSNVIELQKELDSMGFFGVDEQLGHRFNEALAPLGDRIDGWDYRLANTRTAVETLEAAVKAPMHSKGVVDAITASLSGKGQSPHSAVSHAPQSEPGSAQDETMWLDEQSLIPRITKLDASLRDHARKLQQSGLSQEEKEKVLSLLNSVWRMWYVEPGDIKFARRRNGDRKELGMGGYGRVYKATFVVRDTDGNVTREAQVAVKVLHDAAVSAELKAEFLREALLLREATHKRVVRFYGAFWPSDESLKQKTRTRSHLGRGLGNRGASDSEDDDESSENDRSECKYAMLVTELLDGNLAEAMAEGLLSTILQQLRALTDVASALEFLHSKGIVHKDIKPENVLVRVGHGEGVVHAKVGDFGVSRRVRSTVSMTQQASTRNGGGTWTYMPPEALCGSVAAHRSFDLWSFGVLIGDLACTSKSPMSKMTEFDITQAARDGRLESIAAGWVRSAVNERLRKIALSCLRADSSRRPTMAMVAAGLRELSKHMSRRAQVESMTGAEMYRQGVLYFRGASGVEKSEEEAAWWLSQAAEAGDANAQSHPGRSYATRSEVSAGIGNISKPSVDPDGRIRKPSDDSASTDACADRANSKPTTRVDSATRMRLGDSSSGSAGAENAIAKPVAGFSLTNWREFYKGIYGLDVKDFYVGNLEAYAELDSLGKDTALLFARSANSTIVMANNHFYGSIIIPKDMNAAFSGYSQAAQTGNASGVFCVGVCYTFGYGILQDDISAAEAYKLAARSGHAGGLWNLGICYANGDGVGADLKKAFELFHRAADAGDSEAQFYLGSFYEEGREVRVDISEALRLYRLAGLQRHQAATERHYALRAKVQT